MHAEPPVAEGHENSPQAVPVKNESHVHVPAVRSHTPRLEHSAVACAVKLNVDVKMKKSKNEKKYIFIIVL